MIYNKQMNFNEIRKLMSAKMAIFLPSIKAFHNEMFRGTKMSY